MIVSKDFIAVVFGFFVDDTFTASPSSQHDDPTHKRKTIVQNNIDRFRPVSSLFRMVIVKRRPNHPLLDNGFIMLIPPRHSYKMDSRSVVVHLCD